MPRSKKPKPTNRELPGMDNPYNVAWYRQKGESWQAYEAFATYLELGRTRTYAKVGAALDKSPRTIEFWARKWMWVDRKDSFEAEESFERIERMREQRIKAWEKDAHIARDIKDKVVEKLKALNPHSMTVTQMLQAFKLAHEVESVARGAKGRTFEDEITTIDDEVRDLEKLLEEDPELADAYRTIVRAQREQRS